MSTLRPHSLISVWHHRLLGAIWVLGGLAFIAYVLRAYWSEPGKAWPATLVATAYVVVGVRFIPARIWARRAMAALVLLAGLYSADMILMAGWVGNRSLLHWMLAVFGFAAYTAIFILISGLFRLSRSP